MEEQRIKFRQYVLADRDYILEIYDAAARISGKFLDEDSRNRDRANMEEYIDKLETETIVVELNAQTVGFASFIHPTSLGGFYIKPEVQGQGIGRALMKYIQDGRKEIELAVYKKNWKAVRFYRRNGFHKTKSVKSPLQEQEYFVMIWKGKQLR